MAVARWTYAGVVTAAAVIQRLSDRAAQQGYPQFVWWVPLVMYGTTLVAYSIAVVQRVPAGDLVPAAALAGVAMIPWLLDAAAVRVRWYAMLLVAFAPVVALVLLYPVDYDFALIAAFMLVGHFGAIESTRVSAAATVLVVGTVVTLGVLGRLDGTAIWVTGLVLAWDIGFIMQYQQRQLDRQAQDAAQQRAQALQQERQRIAREVHDVLAHSLSVTMLHLTAARRSLEEDDDVTETVDALRDAESAGRQAMAEIRNTVGLLGQSQQAARPAPDARDIAALVEEFRCAGLDVGLEVQGDADGVPAAAGLGVFRIVQESLANVAKHQPSARVGVVVDLQRDRQAVQVWNTLPAPVREGGGGTGLVGMRQRAELLDGSFTAGPRDGLWVVEARLPRDKARSCRLGLPRLGRATGEPEPA